MNERDYNELAGRIEACVRITLNLAARLEDAGMINGPQFSEWMRHSAQPGHSSPKHLKQAQRALCEAADALDKMRSQR